MLPKDKLADFIPYTLETTHVDLLIGFDYFWYIIGGDKIVLPSGMFMLPSRFGYIITRKIQKLLLFAKMEIPVHFCRHQVVSSRGLLEFTL